MGARMEHDDNASRLEWTAHRAGDHANTYWAGELAHAWAIQIAHKGPTPPVPVPGPRRRSPRPSGARRR